MADASRAVAPHVTQVTDEVWSIDIPMPGLTSVTSVAYLLAPPDGPVLVDAGNKTPDGWRVLRDSIAVAGFQPTDIRAVLLTHAHHDHAGCAPRLESAGAISYLAVPELDFLRDTDAAATERAVHDLCERSGADPAELPPAAPRPPADAAPDFRWQPRGQLTDGTLFDFGGDWKVHTVATPGHSPGHCAFWVPSRGLAFGGDTLFASGTPVLSLMEAPDGPGARHGVDPVGNYLRSLDRLVALDAELLLPGHGQPVSGIAARASAVRDRTIRRSQEVEARLASGVATPWQLAAAAQWGRPWAELSPAKRRAALLTTLAILRMMIVAGRLRRAGDPDGVLRYELIA
jgi:glyoxylase-like metal-dependent hydrolase (beta-lactamase superfamily II)